MGDAYRYVMVYTGDTLGVLRRRRRGLAVEPMSCAPNAFESGEGLIGSSRRRRTRRSGGSRSRR
jgi:galactose mutarotase-like enzyme